MHSLQITKAQVFMKQTNERATEYLQKLKRFESLPEQISSLETYVLLSPLNAYLSYKGNGLVRIHASEDTQGNSGKELSELSNAVEIVDPLNVHYKETKILVLREHLKDLPVIPHILSAQAILLSQVTESGKERILELIDHTNYGKTFYDQIWIEENDPVKSLQPGKTVIIMNRRVGGWAGSPDLPAIELLGAGGHVPAIWNNDLQRFQQMNPLEALLKEFKEELDYVPPVDKIDRIGGFHNLVSNELVILYCVFVPFDAITEIQNGARGNHREKLDGIYLGMLEETMELYLENPKPFAGGEEARNSNFPNHPILMERIYQRVKKRDQRNRNSRQSSLTPFDL